MTPLNVFGKKEGKAVDPVCGMEVDAAKTLWNSRHEGAVFHFCCKTCKEAFDSDPVRYATSEETMSHGHRA